MSHVSKSCHTCKWVTCLSHATHVNESRVAREWITSENITEFVICSLLSSCIVRYWVRECITSASLWMHHVRLVSKCGTRRVTHIYESCHVTHMNTSLYVCMCGYMQGIERTPIDAFFERNCSEGDKKRSCPSIPQNSQTNRQSTPENII